MSNRKPLLLTASFACALTLFDTNLVGVVMPSLVAELGADFGQMTWVQSSFLLSFASLLMASGALSDRFGRRRMLRLGLCLFGLSALACSLAPEMGVLIVARAVQGVGAAFLLTPALAIIGHTFREPAESARAWGTWGSLMGLTMVTAPIVSSLAGDVFGWRWAFLVMVAICGVLIIAVPRVIPETSGDSTRPFDWPGAALFCLTMLAFTRTLISGSQQGWNDPHTLVTAALGCAAAGLFLRVERGRAWPMLDLALFRSGRFVGAVIGMLGYAGAAQVMAALLPLYLQKGMNVSFLWTGVAVLPFSVAMFLFPSLARRLSGRWDSAWLLGTGLMIIGAGNLCLSFAASAGSLAWTLAGMAVLGSGGGLINGETQKAILGSLPIERQGMGSGISTTARFFGLLAGFTGLSTILAVSVRHRLTDWLCGSGGAKCPQLDDTMQGVLTGQALDTAVGVPVPPGAVYLQGFSDLFLSAAVIAVLSAFFCIVLTARENTRLAKSAETQAS